MHIYKPTMKMLMLPLLVAPLAFGLSACGSGTTTYKITTSLTNGGTISPSEMTVDAGDSASFSINPLTGFEIKSVHALGCEGQLNGRNFKIDEVNQDCRLTASFSPITFELATQFYIETDISFEHPTISPGIASVNYNQQQTFTLRLPSRYWTFREAKGCPIDNVHAENSVETRFTITTKPVLEPCVLELYIDAPDPDAEFQISTKVVNGSASIQGQAGETDTFNYGDEITIDFIPFGERALTSVRVSPSRCDFEQNGNSIHLIVRTNCTYNAEFWADDEHHFTDNTLLKAFRNALELEPEDVLTTELVASVEEVSVPLRGSSVLSLAGIEAADNLKMLSFRTLTIDLEPLSDLSLDSLYVEVNNNFPVNIEYLANLPLKALSLQYLNAEPEDYEVLGQLHHLEYLDLSYNRGLKNIGFVDKLPQLSQLYANRTGILDLRPLLESGLAYPSVDSFLQVSGCASMEQPVTREVVTELEGNGLTTSVGHISSPWLCPSSRDYYDGSVSASLDGQELSLAWDINTQDNLSCVFYFNLHAQQPRVVDAALEQCSSSGSATFDVGLDIQQLDLYVDNGLFLSPVRVAATQVDSSLNDSSELRLAAVDWGQSTFKANPYLVPERSALLRAHVVVDSETEMPTASATLHLNGESKEFVLTPPESIPVAPVYDSLNASFQLEVPGEWMAAGLEIDISLNDELIYTVSPTFADPTTLYLTVVPMVVNDVAPNIPSDEELVKAIKTYWPVGNVVIERREPYIVEAPGENLSARNLLFRLRDLHAQEGALNYYHGFFNLGQLGDISAAGVAYRPGLVGVSYDRPHYVFETLAHELGHNFSLGHINCGGPRGVESLYPYPPEQIGSIGINYDFSTIYGSEDAVDLMSYCRPRFISDWVYEKAQDYLAVNPPQPFTAVEDFDPMTLSQPVFSTYVSGVIDQVKGTSEILSHFELNRAAGREAHGPFVMIATDSRGRQTERRFAIQQTSESTSHSNGYFNVRLPAFDIVEVRVIYRGQEVLRTKLK